MIKFTVRIEEERNGFVGVRAETMPAVGVAERDCAGPEIQGAAERPGGERGR